MTKTHWGGRLRWFAAEFLVVLTGVLVALWFQSRYEDLQDARRERAYLVQLSSELEQTIRLMQLGDSVLREPDRAGLMLLRAYRDAEPSPDSIVQWLARSLSLYPGRPVTGTLDALIASGDLTLVRSGIVRAAIPTYAANVHSYSGSLSTLEADWQRQREVLSEMIDLNEPAASLGPAFRNPRDYYNPGYGPLPAQITRTPFPLNVDALLRNQRAYSAIDLMNRAKWVQSLQRERIANEAGALLQKVRRALESQ